MSGEGYVIVITGVGLIDMRFRNEFQEDTQRKNSRAEKIEQNL